MLDSDRLHQRRRDHAVARYVAGVWERLLTPEKSALVQANLIVPHRDAARSFASLPGGTLRCQLCGKPLVTGIISNGKCIYLRKTTTARCASPCLSADDLVAEAEATALAADFGAGKLGHAECLVKRQSHAIDIDIDIDQVGRDLTVYTERE